LLLLPALAVALFGAAGAAGGKTLAAECTAGSDWGQPRQNLTPAVADLVNAHRVTLGLRPLKISPTLTAAAVWKARHMARYGYFGHDDPAPPIARSAFDRIRACGYTGASAAENIAAGYRTPATVMQAWLLSPGHRANIEGTAWSVIGLGVAQAASGTLYWVQEFGSGDDSGVAPNQGPRARPDHRGVRRGHRVSVRVLRNDRDADGDRLNVVRLVKLPSHGAAHITTDHARVVYRPQRGFAGTDRFRYEITDGKGGYASAPVVLRVRR
jgi:uncharacterized protein YkwD